MKTDFLVIGSGIAGLFYALNVSKKGKVVVIAKAKLNETNSNKAQGGIAAVITDEDSKEIHIEDTLKCGCFLCDEKVVRRFVDMAPKMVEELSDLGVSFDKNSDGSFHLAREGGHSKHRILHNKDLTGKPIQEALILRAREDPNITILEDSFAIDLLTEHHLKENANTTSCFGAYVLENNSTNVLRILAKVTVLATGGVGNIYASTTNSPIATGDGIAMVSRAGGKIRDMEFIQFHPTSLYNPLKRPSFLITEALRGYGGELLLRDESPFMHKYHSMGSLAPRDVVTRAIDKELKRSGEEFLFLDVRHKNAKETKERFPNIYKECLTIGVDITKDLIPIVPAAHYCCGGIEVDFDSKSSIKNLFAIGETASTGLHGANRLASNSLSEAIVFGKNAATLSIQEIDNIEFNENIPSWDDMETHPQKEMVITKQMYRELQQIMSYYVGIVRTNERLRIADLKLEHLFLETDFLYKNSKLNAPLCELRNMIEVARIIVKRASDRKSSIGLHYIE